MLKWKMEKQLIAWKNSTNRKPLIIKGCRQCGKTFSVVKFAEENYENVVYLIFCQSRLFRHFREKGILKWPVLQMQ